MPFINANLNDAVESEAVPEGTYEVRNHSADIRQSKKGGKDMIVVTSVIEDGEYPHAAPIMTYLSLPHPDDEERSANFKLLQLRRFCEVFDIPFEDNGFDSDDIAGTTAEIAIAQDMIRPNGPDGQPDMSKAEFPVNRLVLPHLAQGDSEEEEVAPPTRRASAPQRPAPAGRGQTVSSPARRR